MPPRLEPRKQPRQENNSQAPLIIACIIYRLDIRTDVKITQAATMQDQEKPKLSQVALPRLVPEKHPKHMPNNQAPLTMACNNHNYHRWHFQGWCQKNILSLIAGHHSSWPVIIIICFFHQNSFFKQGFFFQRPWTIFLLIMQKDE